jgi:hypothetical protein
MASDDPLRRPSGSVGSYLLGTRVLAAVALLALVLGLVSDALEGSFWSHHALLANLAASVIVVMLSVALVNEAVDRRRRRRWRVLAQYVMLELVRHARLVWSGVGELAGLMPAATHSAASIDAGAREVRDTPRLTRRSGRWWRTTTGGACFTKGSPAPWSTPTTCSAAGFR